MATSKFHATKTKSVRFAQETFVRTSLRCVLRRMRAKSKPHIFEGVHPRAVPSAHARRAANAALAGHRAAAPQFGWALSGGAFAASRARIGRPTLSNVAVAIGPVL